MFMRSPEASQDTIFDRAGLQEAADRLSQSSEARTLASLLQAQKQVCYDRKEIVFHEGDAADSVYLLASGMICLYRFMPNGRRLIARFLFAEDMLALSFDDECPFTAECVESTTLYKISRSRLQSVCAHSSLLQRDFSLMLKRELLTQREDILPMMHLLAEARLARLLLMLARRSGASGKAGDRIQLPMTRGDIADFLGLTTETVCRSFAKLKTDGLILASAPDNIRLTDMDGLTSLADGER